MHLPLNIAWLSPTGKSTAKPKEKWTYYCLLITVDKYKKTAYYRGSICKSISLIPYKLKKSPMVKSILPTLLVLALSACSETQETSVLETQDKLYIFLNKEVQGKFFQDEKDNFQRVAGNWSYVEGKDAGDL